MRLMSCGAAIVVGAIVTVSPLARASQSGADAAPPATAHPSLTGTWMLDRAVSNDPAKATLEARAQNGGAANRRAGFGGSGGFGRRGGFGGGGNGGGAESRRDSSETTEERARVRDLTDLMRNASASLLISHVDPNLAVTDSRDHTHLFHTDGSTDHHQLPSGAIDSSSHWEGERLVTTYSISDRYSLIETYTVLANTRQLVLRLRLDSTEGRQGNHPEVKFVYNLTPAGR